MSWFSEKMLISTGSRHGFMPNLSKKSWMVSNKDVLRNFVSFCYIFAKSFPIPTKMCSCLILFNHVLTYLTSLNLGHPHLTSFNLNQLYSTSIKLTQPFSFVIILPQPHVTLLNLTLPCSTLPNRTQPCLNSLNLVWWLHINIDKVRWFVVKTVSKKRWQSIVVIQCCGLSSFFWNSLYFLLIIQSIFEAPATATPPGRNNGHFLAI